MRDRVWGLQVMVCPGQGVPSAESLIPSMHWRDDEALIATSVWRHRN